MRLHKSRVSVRAPITHRGRSFLDALGNRIPGPWEDPRPLRKKYEHIVQDVDAMSSTSKLALLEAAASTLKFGEVYLEIGALFGASAVAAAGAGSDVRLVVVDNFSQFGGSPERFLENVRRQGVADQIELVIDDYKAALERLLEKVGVYFFDGPHSYMDQYMALELGLPHLADEALVIVDDTRWPHVRRANLDFAAGHPALTLLCDFPSPRLNHPGWWNGLQVFEYRANAPDGGRDLRFASNRLRYALLQPMKLYEIYYPHIMPLVKQSQDLAHKLKRRTLRLVRRASR